MKKSSDTTMKEVLHDPSRHFTDPMAVVRDRRLSAEEKLKILDAWALDMKELQIAESEGLDGGESAKLQALEEARRAVLEASGD